MGGVGRDARGAFRLKLLDGRVLEEGKSSKKLPTLGDALSEGGMELPVGGFARAPGRRGTGGCGSTGRGVPVNMLLLLGGGGRFKVGWASELGRTCW